MSHKCTKCGVIYEDGSRELLDGCSCGSRVFLYMKGPGAKEALAEQEIREKDLEWLDREFSDKLEREGRTISIDIGNVVRLSEGKFNLDLHSLMKGDPIVIKAKDGVYYIDIEYAMKQKRPRK